MVEKPLGLLADPDDLTPRRGDQDHGAGEAIETYKNGPRRFPR
jgi:hypothetical protein